MAFNRLPFQAGVNYNYQNAPSQSPSGLSPAVMAARAMQAALANPYASQPNYYFAQAAHYMQRQPMQATTAEGYTLSSTYVPQAPEPRIPMKRPIRTESQPSENLASLGAPFRIPAIYTRTGPGGPFRCNQQSCPYAARTHKDVEIHMMDRHLIYPPDYKQRYKSQPDSDVPPNMPIQGTGIRLDTPEAIEAWIADRRKKWPTRERLQEKSDKLKEALDRGEIPDDRAYKRRRLDGREPATSFRARGRGHTRGRGRGRGGTGANQISDRRILDGGTPAKKPSPAATLPRLPPDEDETSSNSDMDPVRDAVSSRVTDLSDQNVEPAEPPRPIDQQSLDHSKAEAPRNERHRPHGPNLHPKPPLRNSFAERPSLLRKLLLPEIRSTVSNLSQAIRFLVANDFFDGVELHPGEAQEALITDISPRAPDIPGAVLGSASS